MPYMFNILNLSTGELITDAIKNNAIYYNKYDKSRIDHQYIESKFASVSVWYSNPPDKSTLIDIATYLKIPVNALECVVQVKNKII